MITMYGIFGERGDPYWSSVSSFMDFEGPNNATSATDAKGVGWIFNVAAKLTTATFRYGTSCLDVSGGTGAYSIYAPDSLGNFRLRDFTIEVSIKSTASASYNMVFDKYSGLNDGFQLYFNASGYLVLYAATELGSATTGKVNDGAWHDIAVTRSGTTWRVFVDGVIVLTVSSLTLDCNNTQNTYIAAQGSAGPKYPLSGFLDALRITDGVARYTSNYTPTGPFPNR